MAGDERREYLTGLAARLVEMGGSDLHLKFLKAPPGSARQLEF